jgi:metacaspase-1
VLRFVTLTTLAVSVLVGPPRDIVGRRSDFGNARAPEPQSGVRQIALLIAVSAYKNFPATATEPGKSQLTAPVANDLPRMRKSFERWGFVAGEDVKVLADSEASRSGIRAGFEWLAGRVRDSSDVVVVYYSGHGSWAPDLDGDEAKLDPRDHTDEALVPWDAADIHDPSQLVIDDEIRDWLARLPTNNVTVIVDACFSGTITRGTTASRQRAPIAAPNGAGTRTMLDLANPRHTLISAASAGQTASEIAFATATGERQFGVLTYFLSRALDAADSSTRYDELMQRVRSDVRELGDRISPQDPQLEGDRGALLFRVRRPFAPRPIATVVGATADRLTLDVGAVNDVRVGAVYDVYPPSATRFDRGPSRPQIEVDSVGPAQSFAHRAMSSAADNPITTGSHALLSLVPAGARRVNRVLVQLDPSSSALRQAVAGIPFVTVVDSSPDAIARVVDGSVLVEVNGIELVPLEEPDDPSVRGRVTRPGVRPGYPPTTAGLCPPLQRALAITALRAVDNPAAPYIPVQLRLVRDNASPTASASTTVDTAVIGQSYSLFARVSASVTSTLFLTVAVSGYASEPGVLYPDAGRSTSIAVNSWERIVPSISVRKPAGRETLRAVVSSHPFDFQSLIDALPRCSEFRSRGSARDWNPSIEPVTGWAAAQREILVVPAKPRSR